MGVKHFTKFYGECEKIIPVNEFIKKYRGKTVIIDTTQILYTYCIAIRKNKNNIGDMSKVHLYALYKFINLVRSYELVPYFVFDGESPHEKNNVLAKRRNRQISASENIKKLERGTHEYIKEYGRTFSISRQDIEECKILLKKLGYNFIHNKPEADCQCAAIDIHIKDSVGVITNDSDVLLFGAHRILKNFTHNNIRTKNGITVFDRVDLIAKIQEKTDKIIDEMRIGTRIINDNDFINWNILLGTDYCDGVRSSNLDELFKYFVINNCDIRNTLTYIKKNNLCVYNMDLYQKCESVFDIYTNSLVVNPSQLDYSDGKGVIDISEIDNRDITRSILIKVFNDRHA